MLKRIVRILRHCAVLLGALAGLALAALASFLTLSIGEPRSLGPLVSRSAQWADSLFPGIDIAYRDVQFGWRPSENLAELVFSDIRLAQRDGAGSIDLPRLSILCKASPLLSGRLMPREVKIVGGLLRIDWSAERLGDSLQGTAPQMGGPFQIDRSAFVGEALAFLVLPEGAGNPLAGLETVSVRDVDVRIREEASGTVWIAPASRLLFHRAGRSLTLEGEGALETASGAPIANITLAGEIDTIANRRRLEIGFAGLDLSRLSEGIALFAPFAGIRMPVAARLFSEAETRTDRLTALGLSLHAGPGTLVLAPWYGTPRAIRNIDLSLDLLPDRNLVRIRGFGFETEMANGLITGEATLDGDGLSALRLSGGIARLPVNDLVRLWPDGVSAGARNWIARNITAGSLPRVDLMLDLDRGEIASGVLPEESFHLDFGFEGLEVHALRPMPPFQALRGSARLDGSGLVLEIDAGRIEGLPASGSRVAISGFDVEGPEIADILLMLSGPIPDVLRLIDHEPLGYTTAFGIAPEDVRGEARLETRLGFPLVSDLSLEDVTVSVSGPLEAVRLRDVANGADLTDGRIDIHVDRDALEARGSGLLGTLPIRFGWTETFDGGEEDTAPTTRIEVTAMADRAAIALFAHDPAGYIEGEVPVRLLLEGRGPDDIRHGHLEADLGPVRLSIDELGWHKDKGLPAHLAFDLDFSDPRALPLSRIAFAAGTDRLDADLLFHKQDGSLARALLRQVRLGETDLSGEIVFRPEGVLARLGARSLDMRPLLGDLDIEATPEAAAPPFDIWLEVGRLIALGGVEAKNLRARAVRSNGLLELLNVTGTLDGEAAAPFSLDLATPAPGSPERRTLRIEAADAGRLFLGLGMFRNAEGGRLSLDAEIDGAGADFRMTGMAHVADFRLVRSPTLEKVLESEEASRLDEIAGPGGIAFTRLELPFRLAGDIIDIEGALANGPRLGLTLEGEIDRNLDRLNVNGVIVPAYGLNSLLGKIPLLGTLFSGGKGGGMFALAYRVSGPAADPEVDVNMLTALIPGILRKPFEGTKGRLAPRPEDQPADEKAPEPPPP